MAPRIEDHWLWIGLGTLHASRSTLPSSILYYHQLTPPRRVYIHCSPGRLPRPHSYRESDPRLLPSTPSYHPSPRDQQGRLDKNVFALHPSLLLQHRDPQSRHQNSLRTLLLTSTITKSVTQRSYLAKTPRAEKSKVGVWAVV